jgi:uncharacterized protein YdeI (YjbR/CyaY-like superfamily)
MKITHFTSAIELRRWLRQNHARVAELWIGFYNKASGRGGITYPEALDEALCYGWIDGLRKRVDGQRYTIRFTPRRPGSIWSIVNLGHVERLKKLGRMRAAGLAAFAARTAARSGVYSFEQRPQEFPAAFEKTFRANPLAWDFWQTQPPGYRRTATWWVISAKQDTTRQRRLAALIALSAAGQRLDFLAPPSTRPRV